MAEPVKTTELPSHVLDTMKELEAAGRVDTLDTLSTLLSSAAYSRMPQGKADTLERNLRDLIRQLDNMNPETAKWLRGRFSLGYISGDLRDQLEDGAPRPAPPEHMKPDGTPYLSAPGPSSGKRKEDELEPVRTQRVHYQKAMSAEERNDAAMPPADHPGKGPGD